MELSSSDNWQEQADCRGKDTSLFFEQYESDSQVAKEIDSLCSGCPVQFKCLKMGVDTAGTGVHGGTYLNLGQVSKARNSHKPDDQVEQLVQLVKRLRAM
ncbi:WhiB family transcription factor [Rhodococcus phage NiceHouse]|nr:WhiB family transcription factor [Rhodococcus phage NiceHouse]